MKKVRILAIVLTFSLLYKSQIFAEAKNLEQNKKKELKIKKEEYIRNNLTKKEKEKYYVENYAIKHVVEKDIFKIFHYEHEKSHAQFLVFFDYLNYVDKDLLNNEYSKGKLFIKCSPSVDFVTLTAFCNFLNESLEERLKLCFSKQELKYLGFYFKEYFKVANENNLGYGLFLDFKKYDKKLFKNIIEVLKYPEWLKFKKFLKLSIQQTKNNLENDENKFEKFHGFSLEPKMFDRFYFGKYANYGNVKKLDKLIKDEEFLRSMHNKIFNPSNFLIKLNAIQNPNYKEIMKEIDANEYFKYYKEKINKTNEKKLSNFTEKKQYREIELNAKSTLPSEKNSENYKYKARLFWDISKIPEKERHVFLTKNEIYNDFLKEKIKKMGYGGVFAQNNINYMAKDYDSILFDGLYYIDIYGSNKKNFAKEKLEENGQKLVKMLYEKIKNVSDEDLLDSIYFGEPLKPEIKDDFNCCGYENLRSDFDDFYIKTYCLTNNPFNKKYCNLTKDRKVEYFPKDLIETFKKYNKNFETLFNSKPKYIDLFIANENIKKNKDSKNNFVYYFSPILENFYRNKKQPLKNSLLSSLAFEVIYSKFYKPNLIDKNLVRKEFGNCEAYFSIKPKNLAKVEDYIFKKFKKEIKEYAPTKDEVNKIKLENIKNLSLEIKNDNEVIKKYKDILNNNEKFKKYLKLWKKSQIKNYEKNVNAVKKIEKQIKKFENLKTTTKKQKEDKKNSIESSKNLLKSTKKYIKKFKENVKNKNHFSNEVKKHIKHQIQWQKQTIKRNYKKLKCIKKLTNEDFINFYKNLKFNSSSHLKCDKKI